jgi:hypothetical protein
MLTIIARRMYPEVLICMVKMKLLCDNSFSVLATTSLGAKSCPPVCVLGY